MLWSLEDSPEVVIRLRIPEEKFRNDEELRTEVLVKGTNVVLWKENWRLVRRGEILAVEPLEAGSEYREPGSGRRGRRS